MAKKLNSSRTGSMTGSVASTRGERRSRNPKKWIQDGPSHHLEEPRGSRPVITREDYDKALRVLAGHAEDADDLRNLIAALGLESPAFVESYELDRSSVPKLQANLPGGNR